MTQVPGDQMASGNLDKIRDILFGAQARDYERKFATLEEQLLKESADLRNDLKRRFDSLELYIKKEVEAITERVKTEQTGQVDSLKELSSELKDLAKGIEKKDYPTRRSGVESAARLTPAKPRPIQEPV